MATKEKKYRIVELINSAEYFGFRKAVAVGAFYGVNKEKKITKKEFVDTVNEFINREVK